jgi:hypothetical protein
MARTLFSVSESLILNHYPKWATIKAACHLGEAYTAEQGQDADDRPYETEPIAQAMDADPENLEAVWAAWQEKLLLAGQSDKQVNENEARYWLDVVLIGGLANP